MTSLRRSLRSGACLAAALAVLAGCGGDSNEPAPSGGTGNPPPQDGGSATPPPAEEIQGVATPSSVSVVTATNAD